ncbi:SgcJ/EcaC family oxidoreductase [Streptomyces sp. 8N616]|uniref:SgcJ/EcaC family oxidoreductase n=1 Tax=Streptomyces sp. 8N616 TaxID=3457414 RepID=UPI003FCFF626
MPRHHIRVQAAAVVASAVLMAAAPAAYAAATTHAPNSRAGHAAAKAPQNPGSEEIRAQFDLWQAALATGDPERVADRYAPDGVLVPTMSNRIRTDRAGIVDYFEHFLAQKPEARITRSVVSVLDGNSAVDTGTYRFTLTEENGSERTVDARYTFVYEKKAGNWLIINHHSSAMPEG